MQEVEQRTTAWMQEVEQRTTAWTQELERLRRQSRGTVAEFTRVNEHFCVPLGYETIFNAAITEKMRRAKVSSTHNTWFLVLG